MGGGKWKQIGWYVLMAFLFVFAAYSNVARVIRNYHLSQRVSSFQNQVSALQTHNQKLALLLDYYKSPSYQNIQARQQLQLKSPTETTLLIQGVTSPTQTLSDQLDQQIQEDTAKTATPSSNISRWWQFFFD